MIYQSHNLQDSAKQIHIHANTYSPNYLEHTPKTSCHLLTKRWQFNPQLIMALDSSLIPSQWGVEINPRSHKIYELKPIQKQGEQCWKHCFKQDYLVFKQDQKLSEHSAPLNEFLSPKELNFGQTYFKEICSPLSLVYPKTRITQFG